VQLLQREAENQSRYLFHPLSVLVDLLMPFTTFIQGDWTQRHFQQAMDTIDECEAKLANIYGQPNPFSDPPGSYNQEFFQAQWALERDYYRNRNDQQVQKRLELGRLLSLEEDLNNAWQAALTSCTCTTTSGLKWTDLFCWHCFFPQGQSEP
jgi:hypothetical protein